MSTEHSSPRYSSIDAWQAEDIAEAIVEGQFVAVAAVQAARKEIAAAVIAMHARLQGHGRLIYVGAGTSGRLAVQDGAELGPTFGWPEERLVLLLAGGEKALLRSVIQCQTVIVFGSPCLWAQPESNSTHKVSKNALFK
jgi:N-acetylmuramic acid 6-phosphate etherase